MKIGVISAMESEHRRLTERLTDRNEVVVPGGQIFVEGRLGVNKMVLMQCGIGKVNAAVGALELIRSHRPQCIISTGVAGGIDEGLSVGDVVAGAECTYHDVWCGPGCEPGQVQGLPTRFAAHPTLLEHALKAVDPDGRVHIVAGLICTGDRFITDRSELADIKAKHPDGLAVDMESAAIAQVCHMRRVPFLSFRIISDTPGVDGHTQQYTDFWTELADRSFVTTYRFLRKLPAAL